MSFLAVPLGWLLKLLYDLTGQYWLAIVIISVIARGAMYPVYKKQMMSMQNGAGFQTKLREVQQKYANDRAMMNQKIAELQKEEGYNPMAGCLPMLVQLIVISGLFALLRNPLNYLDEEMVFAIHSRFLWIRDMAQPDLWVLPIMAGAATFVASWMSSRNNLNQASMQGGNAMTFIMKYAFPIMIIWLARSYPAGLAIYWFISQFIQIFFNLRFNKIRAKMQAEAARVEAKKKKKR